MRKRKRFSVFNNFNRNYNENQFEPNYYNQYENEFSEELFNRNYDELNRRNQKQSETAAQNNVTVDSTKTDQNPDNKGDNAAEPRNWQ